MFTHIDSILAFLCQIWLKASTIDLRSLAILAVFALLFAWEASLGHVKTPRKDTRQSYLSNLGTFLMNDTLMSLMSVSSLLLLAEHYGRFGLLHGIANPFAKAVLSFLLFDLSLYLWHRANHRFDCLWMFHKVHHSDTTMNVTTAFRLHFVEVVFTTVVKSVFVVVTGVESALVLANEALITLLVMFHHANIRFKGERRLGWLLIVPYLHRIHHSSLRAEHDSNYGAMFSVWDRLFGSLSEQGPAAIGLAGVPSQNALQLVRYGLSCDWTPSPRPVVNESPYFLQGMIAEAAYYRAEKRGFAPGYDYSDWVEAEQEIRTRLGGGGQSGSSTLAG